MSYLFDIRLMNGHALNYESPKDTDKYYSDK